MEKTSRQHLPRNKTGQQIYSPDKFSSKKMESVKVVVRYADGRILKGYTLNFAPHKTSFHLRSLDADAASTGFSNEVPLKELKGIFFVRDFQGNPNYKEKKIFPVGANILGRKIEVTFKDGERLVGTTLGYDLRRAGFFLIPSDPDWNLLRAFVVLDAVEMLRYI